MDDSYKITFLGTVGGTEACGAQLGGAGGFVLQFEGTQIHVDPGPGALLQAQRANINIRATNVLLVSTNRLHACNDVNVLIDAMTYSGLDRTGLLLSAKSVVERSEQERPYITRFHKKCIQEYRALEAGASVKINDMTLKALPTRAPDYAGLGFLITTKEFSLAYTGDTRYSDDLADAYAGCDILVVNNRHGFSEEVSGDSLLCSDETLKLIDRVQPTLVLLTGFGTKLMQANPLYEARDMQRISNVHVLAARPGMKVSPISLLQSLSAQRLY